MHDNTGEATQPIQDLLISEKFLTNYPSKNKFPLINHELATNHPKNAAYVVDKRLMSLSH